MYTHLETTQFCFMFYDTPLIKLFNGDAHWSTF